MNGYILLSRTLLESDIWKKPPMYQKVWIYLLSNAQYKPYKQLERGQLFTSIPDIQQGCSYYVGYRKEIPSKDQIYKILSYLREPHESNNESKCESGTKATMITTTKATHGILVTICNFNEYQDTTFYESNNEANNESGAKPTTKVKRKKSSTNNINEERLIKISNENIYRDFSADNKELFTALSEWEKMRRLIKSPLSDKAKELSLTALKKLSLNPKEQIKIINQSTLHSWKSFYELKEDLTEKKPIAYRNEIEAPPPPKRSKEEELEQEKAKQEVMKKLGKMFK